MRKVCTKFRKFEYEELLKDNNRIEGDGTCLGVEYEFNLYFQGCQKINCEYREGNC